MVDRAAGRADGALLVQLVIPVFPGNVSAVRQGQLVAPIQRDIAPAAVYAGIHAIDVLRAADAYLEIVGTRQAEGLAEIGLHQVARSNVEQRGRGAGNRGKAPRLLE